MSKPVTLPLTPEKSACEDPHPDLTILFETNVDKLRLRKSPNPNAAVVGEVPEKARLEYLFETAGETIELVLRGEKRKGRWHKVRWSTNYGAPKNVEGWVFAGGVQLYNIYGAGDFAKDLQFDFIKVEKISKAAFNARAAAYKNDFIEDADKRIGKDHKISLPLDNGRVKIVSDSICADGSDDDRYDQHEYVGFYPDAGLYLLRTGCYHGEIANMWQYVIRKSDGAVAGNFGQVGVPALSPDRQMMASSFSGDCGSVMGWGVSSLKNGRWENDFSIDWEDQIPERIIWGENGRECLMEWKIYENDNQKESVRYYKVRF